MSTEVGCNGSNKAKLSDGLLRWKHVEGSYAKRDGHCSCACGAVLYIFGGVVQQLDDHTESNELITFDPSTEKWSVIECSGCVPRPRSAATMACVGSKLYLFGGLSSSSGWLNDLHVFDTEARAWSIPETKGSSPSPRDKLASAVVGSDIYFFGGFGPKTQSVDSDEESEDELNHLEQEQEAAKFGWFDDLFVFNTVTNTWSQPMQMNRYGPTPRAAHSMCALKRDLVVFGGRDIEARQNDTHIFNIDTRCWRKDLSISDTLPASRSFHAACAIDDSKFIVTGGRGKNDKHCDDVQVFDIGNLSWAKIEMDEPFKDRYTPRGVHTMVAVGPWVVVYGGSTNFDPNRQQCTRYYGDLYMCQIDDILRLVESKSLPKQNGSANGDDEPSPSKLQKLE